MKKLTVAFAVLISLSGTAQTLFTYGNESVSVKDFLAAYKKNNVGAKDKKSFREYLDLYIASRLKIKEAKAKKLDTLPQIKSDLANLRQQILPAYLNDKEAISKLAEEAFSRSQKDIRIGHIFISLKQNGATDSAAAKQKLTAVQDDLKKGMDFAKIAAAYSDDPAAKQNGGEIGWVTVFSLPYELETLAYNTPVGKTSVVYKSKSGYHIFYIMDERKALGRFKAAQILLAFPPDASDETKTEVKNLADSLYQRIKEGDDFGKLATSFSIDVVSAASNGSMPEFGVGDFDPAFENTVLSMKEGEVSKPFVTTYGYHIVKLLKKLPVLSQKNDSIISVLAERVEQSDRMAAAQAQMTKKIVAKVGEKELLQSKKELWTFSDSAIFNKRSGVALHVSPTTSLLQAGNSKYSVADWIQFASANRNKENGTAKTYAELWNEFKTAKAAEYYAEHLEDYNEDFRRQLKEFADGNLFFEIMQRKVWQPAQSDSVALLKYYQQNPARYNWKESADAVVFYAPNAQSANQFRSQLLAGEYWKKLTVENPDITPDSNRLELAQIPGATKETFLNGTVTPVVVNSVDNSASFAMVLKTYPAGAARTFTEAKPLVMNDYQEEIEQRWIAELRKKYPVNINQKIWNDLVKSRRW